jgi:protoporphyrinogen oxidase
MSSSSETFDVVVLGAGLRGLAAALRIRRERTNATLAIVDEAPQPGGSVRTHRTNGFVCELGPFAFGAAELEPITSLLAHPPAPIACQPGARIGTLVSAGGRSELAVDPLPWSFRGGNEDLVQACRRELGAALRLGRAATAVRWQQGFEVTLGGEVPATLLASELHVALPVRAAGALLGVFDPKLEETAQRVRAAPAAMVFFGGNASDAPTLRGYGILPAPDFASPVREIIFCSEVFPARALPGRFLVRLECEAEADDDALLALAEAELRRWTATTAPLALHKVHRFAAEIGDGALVECRARLRDLPARVRGLHLA